MCDLDQIEEVVARKLRLALSPTGQVAANIVRATLSPPNKDIGAAVPESRGSGPVALSEMETRDIAESRTDVRMVRPERFLLDGQRALIHRFGFGKSVLPHIQEREIVEDCTDFGVIWTECLFFDCEGGLIERLGLRETVLRIVEISEIIEGGANLRIIGAKCFL